MATPRDLNEEGDEEVLEKEITELRLAKKELFAKTRPVNEELERISQRERKCVDRQHSLRAEKHDREKQKQTVERLIEVESELKRVKSENVRLSDTISKLNRSLNQATKYSKTQKLRIAELQSKVTAAERELSLANATAQARSEDDTGTVSELQKQLHEKCKLLNETTEELSGTRQRLLEVQERLTVAEQVTAATQQRALQESGNSDELQLELAPQHQSTTHIGDVIVQYFALIKCWNSAIVSSYESTVKTTKNILENKLNHKLIVVSVNTINFACVCMNAQPAVTSYVRCTRS